MELKKTCSSLIIFMSHQWGQANTSNTRENVSEQKRPLYSVSVNPWIIESFSFFRNHIFNFIQDYSNNYFSIAVKFRHRHCYLHYSLHFPIEWFHFYPRMCGWNFVFSSNLLKKIKFILDWEFKTNHAHLLAHNFCLIYSRSSSNILTSIRWYVFKNF